MMRLAILIGSGLLMACAADLPHDDWLITSDRVLAVKSDPPEAPPGTALAYTALVAQGGQSASGTDSGPELAWYFCTAQKPVTENAVVAQACAGAGALIFAGAGRTPTATTPPDACRRFGPSGAAAGLRPRDPDSSGGYYQPLRIDLSGAAPAFHLSRIRCDLADASAEIAAQYATQYVANANPHLAPLVATIAGETVPWDQIPIGAQVELEAAWSADDAEHYAVFERATQSIVTRREAMRVAWHVSAGTLATESTGRAAGDLATGVRNLWTAPATPGSATLWVVLRDSRGGVDFATYSLGYGTWAGLHSVTKRVGRGLIMP